MNMREYWANEAAAMRDTSGVLGREVLMPVGSNNSSPLGDEVDEKFRTGYWLEGNTIVFSTFVYDNTKKGIAERKSKKTSKAVTDTYMLATKALQSGFKQRMIADIDFKEKSKKELKIYYINKLSTLSAGNEKDILQLKISEIDTDLSEIDKDKAFVSKYLFDFKWKVVDDVKYEYMYFRSDKELPNFYYMNLNDGSGDEGGTHPNPQYRTNSAFFSLGVPNDLTKASRTLVHESLHPILAHVGAKAEDNPIYSPVLKKLQDFISNLKLMGVGSSFIVNQIKKEYQYEIKVILDNIMTTPELEQLYPSVVSYLGNVSSQLNGGKSLHILQLRKILESIETKK